MAMNDSAPNPVIFLAFANDREERVDNRYLRNLPEETRRLRETLDVAEKEKQIEEHKLPRSKKEV